MIFINIMYMLVYNVVLSLYEEDKDVLCLDNLI